MKRATTSVVLCIAFSVASLLSFGQVAQASPVRTLTVQQAQAASVDMSQVKVMAASTAKARRTALIGIHWIRGYSVQDGWLCYGWGAPSWVYHCTLSWHYVGGKAISLNPAFVPNYGTSSSGGTSTAYVVTTSSSGGWSYKFLPGEFCRSLDFGNPTQQWSVPPSCYSYIYYPNPRNFVYRPGFGWCNWWPEVLRPQYPNIWGDPYRGSVPRPGATVFFSGGVQGASSDGHFALVVAVSPGRYWVLVTEMNFYWRGGGWQKVDYRYIHVGWGVTFLY